MRTAVEPIAHGTNFTLKDEIRAYWSKRAETFDQSWGHKIRTEDEMAAWADLFKGVGGLKRGDRVLELASGTGEVSRVLVRIGVRVDAVELCQPMIDRARAKPENAAVRYHLGDAENTMMPDAAYDAVVCRHLVWTLTDPAAAFADWLRVLRPGGALLIADGDWVSESRRARLLKQLSAWLDRRAGRRPLWDQAAHERIMAQVFFRDGLHAPDLAGRLSAAGFVDIRTVSLDQVRRAQWRAASWSERLRLLAVYDGDTFFMTARRPA